MAVECGAALNRGFEDETTRAAVVEAFCSARQGIARSAETVIPAGGIVMALLALANLHEIDSAATVNRTSSCRAIMTCVRAV